MVQAKPAQTFDIWLKADVEIAADGTVKKLTWLDDRPAAKLVIALIEPRIKTWEFVPGNVDGQPALTQTYLSVQVLGEGREDGALALKFGEARTGALSETLTPPSYPHSAARAGVSATVVTEVDVGIDGVPTIRSMTFDASRGGSYRKEFVAAAEAAIKTWTIRPEKVAGHPVSARMRIPIDFCAPGSGAWCTRLAQSRKQSENDAERSANGEPVALDSVVRLRTKIDGQKI